MQPQCALEANTEIPSVRSRKIKAKDRVCETHLSVHGNPLFCCCADWTKYKLYVLYASYGFIEHMSPLRFLGSCDASTMSIKKEKIYLPILLHIDWPIVIILHGIVVIRLITACIVARVVHVCILTTSSRSLP